MPAPAESMPLNAAGSGGATGGVPAVPVEPSRGETAPPVILEPPEMTAAPLPDAGTSAGQGDAAAPSVPSPPGPPVPTEIPIGVGRGLTPLDGMIFGLTNEVGIQGSFFTLSDADEEPAGFTNIVPSNFIDHGTLICVSGVTSQVFFDNYAQFWGAAVGLTLADPGQNQPVRAWNRGRVTGFYFNITGLAIPPPEQFRFSVRLEAGPELTNYCAPIVEGANSIRFDELRDQCFSPGGAALPADAELRTLQWTVSTIPTATTSFDFCIRDLIALVDP